MNVHDEESKKNIKDVDKMKRKTLFKKNPKTILANRFSTFNVSAEL